LWQKFTDVSEELTASFFRFDEKTKQAPIILLASLLYFLFDPGEAGSDFLRNVGKLLPEYTPLHPDR
jgi:hypothetical protein